MDTALIVITLLSIGLTGWLLVYAARLQREQREREDARVAALAQELRIDAAAPPVFSDVAWGAEPDAVDASRQVRDPREPHAPGRQELFVAGADRASSPRRFPVALVGAVAVSLLAGAGYLVVAGSADRVAASNPATTGARAGSGALELVTLEQERAGATLTVRGVVRNPQGGARRRGVAAVVFVFDRSGGFVTSARAAIDYQVLEAGDESPFTVTIPGAAAAARYKVSFRAEREVLPHVDRRQGAPSGAGRLDAKNGRGLRAPAGA